MALNVTHRTLKRKADLEKDHPELLDFEHFSEKTVWDNFRNGSNEAYSYMYIKFFPVLYNYGRQFTSDTTLVKDAIQDLFVELWKNKERLSSTDSIKYYLLSSTRRRIFRSIKRLKNLKRGDDQEVFGIVMPIEAQIIADQSEKEKVLKVREAVNKLTPQQREVIFLSFYENLSHDQIAKMLSIEVKTVYNLMGKAIHGLRKIIASILVLLLLA
ncbi:MAG: sigma-70 family RNA polymerase sigma factor [Cyclobacteriaceae bacterium]|nr:sigma-70 family RNA polymerase sigma factor [Cyclobacteriaceae bacterium HetDA_MAG_MS6]